MQLSAAVPTAIALQCPCRVPARPGPSRPPSARARAAGEAARRPERAVHDPAAAGQPAAAVQAGPAAGASARGAHPVAAGHHAGALAVRQAQQPSGEDGAGRAA